MSFNPFEEPAADEAQTKTAPVVVNASGGEGKIVVTLKGGKGYEAPWIVVHANSVDEAHKVFDDKRFHELMERTLKAGAYFAGKA